MITVVCYFQALLCLFTGLWPILHLRSFEKVTGPKADGWLVKTLGAVITVIGGSLFYSAWNREFPPQIVFLGFGTALVLGLSDVIYARKGRISKIYLVDAAVEFPIAVVWVWFYFLSRGVSV